MRVRYHNDLLRLRARAGLSRRELAERSGVSLSAIFAAECGTHKTRPSTERAIREALGASMRAAEDKANPPFSMRCRWCGEKITSIRFDAASGQMTILDKTYRVFNGWFYHAACLEVKIRVDAASPTGD